jgi:hypothetical protein
VSKPKLEWRGDRAFADNVLRYKLRYQGFGCTIADEMRSDGRLPWFRECPNEEAAKAACERHWEEQQ